MVPLDLAPRVHKPSARRQHSEGARNRAEYVGHDLSPPPVVFFSAAGPCSHGSYPRDYWRVQQEPCFCAITQMLVRPDEALHFGCPIQV